jgi:hypothetical protein
MATIETSTMVAAKLATRNANQGNRRGTSAARRSNDMSFGNGASISADAYRLAFDFDLMRSS